MKKLMLATYITILTLALASCGINDPSNQPIATPTTAPVIITPTIAPTEKPVKMKVGDKVTIGKYDVIIKQIVKDKDFSTTKAIIISYDLTNNSKDTAKPNVTIFLSVIQDGVKLKTAYIKAVIDAQKSMTEVRPGITMEGIQASFTTVSANPIEIEVNEYRGFWNPVVVSADFPTK